MRKPPLLVLLAAAILGAVATSAQEPPLLVMGPGALAPWHIVRARVESTEPILTRVAVLGRTWEGGSRLLFESAAPGLSSFDAAFWIDDDIAAVSLVSGSGSAEKRGPEIPVSVEGGMAPPYLPYHSPRSGNPPSNFLSHDPDPVGRAAEAVDRLFVSRLPVASVLLLFALFLASLALAAPGLRRRLEGGGGRRFLFPALQGLLVLVFGTAALIALPGERELFVAAIPVKAESAPLLLRETNRENWSIREWGEGPRKLIGFRLWPGRNLPLDLILAEGPSGLPFGDNPEAEILFSKPPLVVGNAEGLALQGDSFLTGWIIDE